MLAPAVFLLWTAAGTCLLIATWKNGLKWKFEGGAEAWAFAVFTLWILSLVVAGVAT